MTTLISKVLTVFVTIASVAFMAVIMANVEAGGPNWMARSKELKEVEFARANPEAPWTAKKRTDGADMGGGPILPAAIAAAQKKLIEAEKTVQTELDQKINGRKSATTEAKALIDVDLDAMKRRQTDLDLQYTKLLEDLLKISQDYTTEAKKQTDDLATLKLRAQEYIQVKNQLEELRSQRIAATEELDRLKALVYQAKANLERAQTRHKLLVEDGVATEAAAPAAETAPAEPVPAEKPAEPAEKPTEKPPE